MIEVTASDRTYTVEMNSESKNQYLDNRKVAVIVPKEMRSTFAKVDPQLFKSASLVIEVPEGESQKSIKTVETIWEEFGTSICGAPYATSDLSSSLSGNQSGQLFTRDHLRSSQ